ncbi:CE1759 family FMN reductase [Gordonia rhizosphera]|uniref:Putative NAD(P)H-dependent FMN reductase n=1 Tax=Gordonia rhizosphera NBRC 16068 TaxID=1108045 RepID=K6VA60_9ACTN|nr:CE1759 family FMN reductase [Gordonia rhizosphera]GAB93103.1 putative NAD(P)H-dependent FMN reductase [Gordonia rhizosphera NBRC 16068]
MSAAALSLVAVNAGLGEPSSTRLLVDRLVDAVTGELADSPITVDVTIVDLRDLVVDIGRSLASGFAVGAVREAVESVQAADSLIAATPVFNASYSGLFKSFFDLVDVDRMEGKPVLIAATGGSPRHSMVLDHAMRPLFSYLRAVVVPTVVYAAAEDWAGTSGDTALLSERVRRAARELVTALRVGSAPAPAEVTRAVTAPRSDARDTAAEAAGIANFARLLGESA